MTKEAIIRNAQIQKVIYGYSTVWLQVRDNNNMVYRFNILKDNFFWYVRVGGFVQYDGIKGFYYTPERKNDLKHISICSTLNAPEPERTALDAVINEHEQYQKSVAIAFEEVEKLQKIVDEDKRKLVAFEDISKNQIEELKYKIKNYEKREKISNLLTVIAVGLLVVVFLSCI